MTVQLICEGAECNPDLSRYDEAVKAALRKSARNEPPIAYMTRYDVEMGRSLKHTPHFGTGMNFYACSHCGTSRKWGNG